MRRQNSRHMNYGEESASYSERNDIVPRNNGASCRVKHVKEPALLTRGNNFTPAGQLEYVHRITEVRIRCCAIDWETEVPRVVRIELIDPFIASIRSIQSDDCVARRRSPDRGVRRRAPPNDL